MDSETRHRSPSQGSTGRWHLPHKAALAPAEVYSQHVSTMQNGQAVPRDFSLASRHSATSSGQAAIAPTTATSSQASEEMISASGNRRFSRVSEILHKSIDSPPESPRLSAHFTVAGSPYSSTDSLASLVERQQQNMIINPSHQNRLFCNSGGPTLSYRSQVSPVRRSSQASLLAVLQGKKKRASDSNPPAIKSPLSVAESRRMHPHLNPHHVHSSPSVKESKTVSLGYDPVSRKKMLNSYEIIKEIGRGEHGKVKLAKHVDTEELVAIKIVDRKSPKKSFRPGSSHEEKIRREIAIMKKINHPNVVQLKEVMDDINSRKIYLVLEYLEKGEVKWQKARDVPMMSLKESMKVFRDVVLGLEYLHYQGIVHRDIKPANLLIAGDGSVKISDFGVSFASSLKTGEQDDYDLAKTAGTPAFLAPELCRPLDEDESEHPKITYKIDIWALGVTLYCFLFGKLPFWATNEYELFDVIYSKELTFPETFPPGFTDDDKEHALDLLTKILDKEPKKRLTINEIKKHPLTLRDLTSDEVHVFVSEQDTCVCKIDVSNEEVQIAVTGLGGKLRQGLAKALKFAGLQRSREAPVIAEEPGDGLTCCDSIRSHRRVKSGDIQSETHANVAGDIFLNTESALNSLNNIFNDDKKRSSTSLNMSTILSTSDSYATSNDSYTSRGTQMVSLPVNASFASLDSVYLDNFAPSYAYTSITDARARPPHREVFSGMNEFKMNKATERKSDDNIAPHVRPKFMLHDEGEDESGEEGESEDGCGDDYADQLSEISIPSYLVQDLGGNAPEQPTSKSISKSSHLPTRGAPKYSFFETSEDSDTDNSGPDVVFAESSDEESDVSQSLSPPLMQKVVNTVPVMNDDEDNDEDDESADEDYESADEDLILSFSSRQRHNTISVVPTHLQPRLLERVASPLANNAPKTPISSSNAHLIAQKHLTSSSQQSYANHYHRVQPDISFHDPLEARARSNSITVGLLQDEGH